MGPEDILRRYFELGWQLVPLEGKRAFIEGWPNLKFTLEEFLRYYAKGCNVGVKTTWLEGGGLAVVAVDPDEPKLLNFDPDPWLRRGAMAHTTSTSLRIVFYTDSQEVAAFSRKVAVRPEDLSEGERGLVEKGRGKGSVTLLEVLAEGRQFMAPPSVHPETGRRLEWVVGPLEPSKCLVVHSLEELRQLLDQSIRRCKWVIEELFETSRLEAKGDSQLLRGWLEEILGKLKPYYAGETPRYYTFHCPFHGPDRHPSFVINKQKFYGYDYHTDEAYSLKGLAERLGLELKDGRGDATGGAAKPSGDFSVGGYRLGLIGKDVFLYDVGGKPVFSCKLRSLNAEGTVKRLAEITKADRAEVERSVAAFIFTARTRGKAGAGAAKAGAQAWAARDEEEGEVAIKVAGRAAEGYYEAIYHDGGPAFLVYSNGQFKVLSEVHEGGLTVRPPSREMCPYPPYRYYGGPVDTNALREEVYAEYDSFADADARYKHRWTVETFMTYQHEKLTTVPYEFLMGGEGSGKTHVGILMSYLMYRPLWGASFPAADIFTYLSMHQGGTIIEDEVQGIEKDREKLKIYLVGYKQGAVVPRVFDLPDGRRLIRYFPCFGFKVAIARQAVKDDAFMERFIIARMVEGCPRRDEFRKEDVERLLALRDKLLKWRMQNMDAPLAEVDPQVTGRLKELWTPLLQVGAQIGLEREMRGALALEYQEYRGRREESLEAVILRAYLNALLKSKDGLVPSDDIWSELLLEPGGVVDPRRPDWLHTAEHGDVSKALVGRRLKDRLAAERKKIRVGDKTMWAWCIPEDRLLRLVRRYICSCVPDLRVSREGDRTYLQFYCPYFLDERGGERTCRNEAVNPSGQCRIGNAGTFSPSLGPNLRTWS